MKAPLSKHVSKRAAPAVVVSWIAAVLLILLVVSFSGEMFPDREHINWDIWASGAGASRSSALVDVSQSRSEALSFLNQAGFEKSKIAEAPAAVDQSLDKTSWSAEQQFTVEGESYARFAGLSDEVLKRDPSKARISSSFPPIPFQRTLWWLITFTLIGLCLSVAALENRFADVTAPPRGMNPVIIAGQTLMFTLLVAYSLAYLHAGTVMARTPYVAVGGALIASLCVWLFWTRAYWRQVPFLANAFWCYVGAVVAAVALVVVVIGVGPH